MSETQTPTTTTTTTEEPPAWAKNLFEGFEKLTGLVGQQSQNIDKYIQAANQRPAPEEQEVELSDAELEALPRSRFAEYIANKTLKHAQKTLVDPLQQRLRQVTDQTSTGQLAAAVEAAKAKYPDFMDFRDEMVAIAKSTGGSLPPEDLYHLARAKNPNKVKATTPTKTGDEGAGTTKKIRFGGITPGAGSGTGPRNQSMAPAEAVESAWAETVAALGGEPAFEE